MHIPDGFLDTKAWVSTTIAGAAAVSYTLRRTKLSLSNKRVPAVALIGAFIFAAQMINFPIAGATSGHFLGGTLTSILFGPWIGAIVMTAVLLVQAFVFQDGGITVLGANILCTGFIGCFAGYGVFRAGMSLLRGKGRSAVTFAAAWVSVVCASAGVALLLGWSGTVPLAVAFKAMVGWHMLIGIGEGVITTLVAGYLLERNTAFAKWERGLAGDTANRPRMNRVESESKQKPLAGEAADGGAVRLTGRRARWIALLAATLVLAGLLSPYASQSPDGLDRVAKDHGFAGQAGAANSWAPLPGYEVLGIPWSWLRIGLAGLAGVIVLGLLLWLLTTGLAAKGADAAAKPEGAKTRTGRRMRLPETLLQGTSRRLLAVLAVLASVMLLKHTAVLSGTAVCLLIGMLWNGLTLRHIARRLLLIVPFGLGAAVFLPFHGGGEPLWTLFGMTATADGVRHAAVVLLKIVCANLLITWLLAASPLFELIKSFRSLGVPAVLIETVGLMMRYFFLIKEEAGAMLKAQRSRGLKLDGWFWSLHAYKRFGQLLGVLFIRAYQRSLRIHRSITARGGFSGSDTVMRDMHVKRDNDRPEVNLMEGRGKRQMAVEVKDAVYRYGEVEALKGVSFSIERGAKVALMGPNGAGKSTLISLLNGLEQPTSGEVRLFGERMTADTGGQLRRRVGVVYQDPDDQIFSTTVEEDVAFGPRSLGLSEAELAERVETALGSVGMRELRGRSPFELSYGQKRRVAIAGVLAMRPEMVILDEPMAFLDPKSRDDLQALLESMHLMGMTLMVATHDVDFAAEWADRVIVLKEGRLLAAGTTDLLFDDELLAAADLHLPRLARPFRLLQGSAEANPRTVRQAAQLIWKLMVRGVQTPQEEASARRRDQG